MKKRTRGRLRQPLLQGGKVTTPTTGPTPGLGDTTTTLVVLNKGGRALVNTGRRV